MLRFIEAYQTQDISISGLIKNLWSSLLNIPLLMIFLLAVLLNIYKRSGLQMKDMILK